MTSEVNAQMKNDTDKVGILGRLKNLVTRAFNAVTGFFTGAYKFINDKAGDYSGIVWIMVGVLVLALFSPQAGINVFLNLVALAIYITLFIVIWNAINNAFANGSSTA